MKILVTGAAGFLGTKVMKLLKDDFELVGTDREGIKGCLNMDITKREEVDFLLRKFRPDIVLHIAAMADVDRCEIERRAAHSINVMGTLNVVGGCSKISAKIVHISTDVVFNGGKGDYREDDLPDPLSYYARTKLEAEEVVRRSSIRWLIIRPEVLYGYNGDGSERSFTMWAYNNLKEGKEIRVVDDQFNTPTLTDDIANAIKVLVKKGREGIYHVAGSEGLSRYDMAVKVAEVFGLDKKLIKKIKTAELKQTAPRPRDTSLNIEKLKKEGVVMHSFGEGLRIMKKQMKV